MPSLRYIPFDKKIPIPPRRPGGAVAGAQKRPRIQWRKMAVGDSVFLPRLTTGRAEKIARAARVSNPGYRFSIRLVEGGVRIWRTE